MFRPNVPPFHNRRSPSLFNDSDDIDMNDNFLPNNVIKDDDMDDDDDDMNRDLIAKFGRQKVQQLITKFGKRNVDRGK